MTDILASQATATRPAAELLQAVAAGDRRAFDELYKQLANRAFGLILHLIKNRAQAEEVLQEVFLEVWRSAPAFDPNRGAAATWVMTISHRKTVDRIRASQAAHDRDLRIGARDFEQSYEPVESEVEIKLESQVVANSLRRLTELQREAVTLAYYRGLTYREISETLKVPIGTVKTRVRDGLIRLRDELGVVR